MSSSGSAVALRAVVCIVVCVEVWPVFLCGESIDVAALLPDGVVDSSVPGVILGVTWCTCVVDVESIDTVWCEVGSSGVIGGTGASA